MEKKDSVSALPAVPIDNLWQDYLNGSTLAQIAADHCVTAQQVYRRFKANGLTYRRFGKNAAPFTSIQLAEMIVRYRAGESCAVLAREFGAAEGTVANHLKRNGVTI